MAYKQEKNGDITWSGWENGIGPSPYSGIADAKAVNISSIKGEISVAYNRSRLDQASLTGQTMTFTGSHVFAYSTNTLPNGTWIKVTAHTGTPGTTDNNYYYLKQNVVGVSYTLWTDFGTTQMVGDSGNGTITFSTLTMGIPVDYVIENYGGLSSNKWRYFVLDQSGVIWVVGTGSAPDGTSGGLSASSTWSAITPHGSTTGVKSGSTATAGASIAIMYATDSGGLNKIQATFMLVFMDTQILWFKSSAFTDATHGWPSNTGADASIFQSLNYQNYPHKSMLGNDQVLYFTDGPGLGILQQKSGQQFDPLTSSTYNYVNANYLMAPTDAATRIAFIPSGNGLSVVVGGQQNNIYIYPTYQNSTASGAAPTSVLWMPEANTQFLLQTNNYVLIFPGNKGNIYLTNGSSVVPLLTVPDYVAGAINYVQDPYFIWGGATYIRGRVFFSIKDQTGSHTGNCGGVWSFVPSFSYYPNQDVGTALRMESASSTYATDGYNGYAPVLFAGLETTAQQANGSQYVACWAQSANSVDFSGTSPITNSSARLELEAVPVGTLLDKKTYSQIEVKLSAALASGESITPYYRTSLEGTWTSAGTLVYESDNLAGIVQGVPFQKSQIIQLAFVLNSTASSPSWVRIKEIYLRSST